MIICFTSLDTENPVYLNPDYITEVDPIDDGIDEYSRIYLSAGHRTFIDVKEDPQIVYDIIKNNELYVYKHIIGSELKNLMSAVNRVGTEIKSMKK